MSNLELCLLVSSVIKENINVAVDTFYHLIGS